MDESVLVLLSTYNGDKYIIEQLESILNQRDVDVIIDIRDDGSSDSTVSILKEYEKRDSRIRLKLDGKSEGAGKSFMKLLFNAEYNSYYAFSDQDDIWYENKLISAINSIQQEDQNIPVLYCCNQRCIDDKGNFLFIRFPKNIKPRGLMHAVFANYFAGCTMVFNNKLKEALLNEGRHPELDFFNLRIHDAWTACVAYATGIVLFDLEPHMNFRRHVNTFSDEYVPGNKKGIVKRYIGKLNRARQKGVKKNAVSLTAYNLLKYYSVYLERQIQNELYMLVQYKKGFKEKMNLINSGILKKYSSSNMVYIKIFIGLL